MSGTLQALPAAALRDSPPRGRHMRPLIVSTILSLTKGNRHMTTAGFRRIALSPEGVEEYPHTGLQRSNR
jgi:hypothetical protein